MLLMLSTLISAICLWNSSFGNRIFCVRLHDLEVGTHNSWEISVILQWFCNMVFLPQYLGIAHTLISNLQPLLTQNLQLLLPLADSFWENTDCQHSSQEFQFSHEWLTFYPIQSLQASGFWSFRLRWIEWFILSTCLDWGGLNDSSSPLAKLSTWHPCHFFGNLVSLSLHIIESGDYGVERLSRDKLATLLKWCTLYLL